MALYILESDLAAVMNAFANALAGLKKYEGPDPAKPIPDFNPYVPAKTEAEALANAMHAREIDGVTLTAETKELLDYRIGLTEEWRFHPNLEDVQPAMRTWGILTGRIKPPEGGLSVGGHPICPENLKLPRVLQDEVDAVNTPHEGGPSIQK